MVVNSVAGVNLLSPDFELSRHDFKCISRVEDVECENSSSEFALIGTVTTKLEKWLPAISNAVCTTEARGFGHGDLSGGLIV